MHPLPKALFDQMKAHALEAYPEECCGFILYDVENDCELVRRVPNVATERHQKDPQTFPRDGRDGYIMDEKELFTLHKEIDDQLFEIRTIYHSHPNGKAYFSKEDEARAKLFDEPIYPEAVYLVLGCDGQSVTAISGHQWNAERLEYEDFKIVRV